jgi:choline monooxygenase
MARPQDLFSFEAYTDVRKPLLQATTLPPHCYTSPDWYEREIERVWLKSWINVGRQEEIPNTGDFVRRDVVGEPLLMVRDKKGAVRVLSAICRHRGCLVAEGSGHTEAFICPYHGWTYTTEGQLIGVPGIEDFQDFDRADFGLIPVRSELWGGFVFVNFDPNAPPLMDSLGELAERFRRYRFEDMVVTRRLVNLVECNWKVWLENSREGYHVPVTHKETIKRYFPGATPTVRRSYEKPGFFEVTSVNHDMGFYVPRDHVLPDIDGLEEDERSLTHFVMYYPHLILNIPPSHLAFHQLLPEGPDRTTVVTWVCFPKTTVALPDFEASSRRYYEILECFVPEDKRSCELVQRGLRGRLARAGRFARKEKVCHGFANWLLDRVLGSDSVAELAAPRPS